MILGLFAAKDTQTCVSLRGLLSSGDYTGWCVLSTGIYCRPSRDSSLLENRVWTIGDEDKDKVAKDTWRRYRR